MSDLVKILHLSDLHLQSPLGWNQQLLIDALKKDLHYLRYSSQKPDLLVISGDVVDKADDSDAFDIALNLIVELQQIVGIDEDHTILCAGNHDVQRTYVEANLETLRKFRLQALTGDGLNALTDDPAYKKYADGALGRFHSLEQTFGAANRVQGDQLSSSYFFKENNIGIVVLNSSVLCAGGLKGIEEDANKLGVSEKTIITARSSLPENAQVVMIVHHPAEFFNEEARKVFESTISQRCVMLLSGHMHYAKPLDITSLGGHVLFAQSGALYSSRKPERDYWNGYSTICLCTNNGMSRVSYRRWFEQRREFAKAEDLKSNGEYYSSEEARAFWKSISPTFDPLRLEHWRSHSLLPQLERDLKESLAGPNEDGRFIEPDFESDRPFKSETESRIGSRLEVLSLDQVAQVNTNIVIAARAETGKSTLLARLAVIIADSPYDVEKRNNPVVISFGSVRNFHASVGNAIRAKLKNLPDDLNADDMITAGMITVMVDDVDFSNTKKRDALVEYVSLNRACRYIFASSTPFVDTAALKPEIVKDVPFTKITMRAMRRGQLLALVESHGLTDPLAVDQMVERVMRDASSLNVPLTAVTGSFLIQIFREQPDSKVINQAALIERYIDICLEKYAPKDILPGTFDFKNKVDLLCYITERLIRGNVYAIDENEFTAWCIEYLKNYGLKFSAQNLVDYFVQSRIIQKDGGKIRFRLRIFASFFAATRMRDDGDFCEYIFDKARYLSFANEIGFYCALDRRDLTRLTKIWDEFSRLTEELYPNSDPNADLAATKLPGQEATEEEVLALQSSLSVSQLEEERKALMEGTELVDDNQERGFEIVSFKSAGERWTGHLILLSGMVKHMELIKNNEKTLFLVRALDGWVRFASSSLNVIPELAKNRRVVFNGVTYRTSLSDEVAVGEVARRLTLYMPIAVARLATAFLGTEKLQSQIEEGIGSSKEPLARQFFRVAILADLGVDNFVSIAERAQNTLRSNDYLNHVYARKIYEIAVRFRMTRDKINKIKALVGSVFVSVNNTKRAGVGRMHLLTGIDQQRLRIELEEKAAGKAGGETR